MSGRRNHRNNISPRKPEPTETRMTAVLDQLATDATTKRQTQPEIQALEPAAKNLYTEFQRLCGHLDEVTAGAVLMVAGQLAAINVRDQPDDQKVTAAMRIPMLLALVGAQLYTGSTSGIEIACPFTFLTGVSCTKTFSTATRQHADLLMRGHVWQNHPGETWPPVEDEDGAGQDVADAVNLAPTDPAALAAAMRDLEAEFPDDGEEPSSRTGLCPECAQWIYLEDNGQIGTHPTGEDGNQRTCAGAGREPKADGEVEG